LGCGVCKARYIASPLFNLGVGDRGGGDTDCSGDGDRVGDGDEYRVGDGVEYRVGDGVEYRGGDGDGVTGGTCTCGGSTDGYHFFGLRGCGNTTGTAADADADDTADADTTDVGTADADATDVGTADADATDVGIADADATVADEEGLLRRSGLRGW
jgi:hypothetical protein